jgi:hypothetical protein
MASWRKMLMVGTTWIIFISVFVILVIIDGVFWGEWDKILLTFPIPAPVASYVGQTFWIQPFSYFFILILAIIITYKVIQATADETDYFPELQYDQWGPR